MQTTKRATRIQALATALRTALISYKLAARGKSIENILGLEDDLTGLPNRKAFYKYAEKTGACPVAIIDCDNFKAINDTQGHERGDMVLRVLGSVLQQSGAYAARLGGDEFAMVFPAKEPMEDILNTIQERAREWAGISLSIGISGAGETLSERLRAADQAMYRCKGTSGKKLAFAESRTLNMRPGQVLVTQCEPAHFVPLKAASQNNMHILSPA